MTTSPQTHLTALQVGLASQLFYIVSMTSVKISILSLYAQLLSTRRFQIAITILGLLCLSWLIASLLTTLLQYMPVPGAWNVNVKSQCISFSKMSLGIAISNMGTNFLILVLPLQTIWGLRLPRRQKLVLSLIFFRGSL